MWPPLVCNDCLKGKLDGFIGTNGLKYEPFQPLHLPRPWGLELISSDKNILHQELNIERLGKAGWLEILGGLIYCNNKSELLEH